MTRQQTQQGAVEKGGMRWVCVRPHLCLSERAQCRCCPLERRLELLPRLTLTRHLQGTAWHSAAQRDARHSDVSDSMCALLEQRTPAFAPSQPPAAQPSPHAARTRHQEHQLCSSTLAGPHLPVRLPQLLPSSSQLLPHCRQLSLAGRQLRSNSLLHARPTAMRTQHTHRESYSLSAVIVKCFSITARGSLGKVQGSELCRSVPCVCTARQTAHTTVTESRPQRTSA